MLTAMVSPEISVEFEREPPVLRKQGYQPARHDALPDTRYRYRARARTNGDCPAGPWSDWSEIRTPQLPSVAPIVPQMLEGTATTYVVTLRWRSGDRSADGFVLEQCFADNECRIAALLNPDRRQFDFHTTRAGRFRIYAFNTLGQSDYSNRTELLGSDVLIKQSPEHVELGPADSHAAKLIDHSRDDYDLSQWCTTPEELIAGGWTLIGVRGMEDLYRDADGCGTGGCVYHRFTVNDGCYGADPDSGILTTTPPFSGKDDDSAGVVLTNTSGSAGDGKIIIYDGLDVVDSYFWDGHTEPAPGVLPPFDDTRQFPGN